MTEAEKRRATLLEEWAVAARGRDYAEAGSLALCIFYVEEVIELEGGKRLDARDYTAAMESAIIPWYNDVCAEYLED